MESDSEYPKDVCVRFDDFIEIYHNAMRKQLMRLKKISEEDDSPAQKGKTDKRTMEK